MTTRDIFWPTKPTVTEFIDRLPLAIALADQDGSVKFVNACFKQSFDPACLDSIGLEDMLNKPSAPLHSIRLTDNDGQEVDASAQAIDFGAGTMLVVSNSGIPDSDPRWEQLNARIATLEKLSSTDTLTGAWNRRHLDRVIESELSRSLRSKQPVSLILIDVDHFKGINDLFGHPTGDSVLRELVEVIGKNIRASDSITRWGGEEFVVLAPSTGYRAGALLAEKLRSELEQHAFAGVPSVTVSIGVAEYFSTESAENWFRRVDAALYAAKNGGRNRVCVDRQGSSDLWAAESRTSALRLTWQEAYECGEPTIDREHRELFELANALIAAAVEMKTDEGAFMIALDALLEHVARHFADEEALLAQHGYDRLDAHKAAHANLLKRATELKASAATHKATLGGLVDFLAHDVVAHHLFTADRAYFPLFKKAGMRQSPDARAERGGNA